MNGDAPPTCASSKRGSRDGCGTEETEPTNAVEDETDSVGDTPDATGDGTTEGATGCTLGGDTFEDKPEAPEDTAEEPDDAVAERATGCTSGEHANGGPARPGNADNRDEGATGATGERTLRESSNTCKSSAQTASVAGETGSGSEDGISKATGPAGAATDGASTENKALVKSLHNGLGHGGRRFVETRAGQRQHTVDGTVRQRYRIRLHRFAGRRRGRLRQRGKRLARRVGELVEIDTGADDVPLAAKAFPLRVARRFEKTYTKEIGKPVLDRPTRQLRLSRERAEAGETVPVAIPLPMNGGHQVHEACGQTPGRRLARSIDNVLRALGRIESGH